MIVDSYDREHNYLRISLTDRCNLRCAYCMPDEEYDFMPVERLMQPGEIAEIASIFVSLGVDKIRLTGGEPLARKDFGHILNKLATLPVELSITTNATLLHRHLPAMQEAGLYKTNISLDTLSPATFFRLTRRDKLNQTFENIHKALEAGMQVKLNMVVMKGINDHEISDFVAWTKKEDIEVRFIEFMPFTDNQWSADKVFPKQKILEEIERRFSFQPMVAGIHSTSQPYQVAGHKGRFAIISTMTAPFCAGCNRMRLTADGKMKNCLFSKDETDLLGALRRGEALEPLIRSNIFGKAEKLGGQFGDGSLAELQEQQLINRSMISIGG